MITETDFREFQYNVLGAKSRIVGDLILHGDAIVNSEIEGSIEVRGEGKLILERGSHVTGRIKAFDIEVFGTVVGDIDCPGLVAIRSSARIQGSIKSGRLVIYPGAIVEMEISTQEPGV
ncbi:MAG TPA: polymer-forming cytoskeletal protein [Bacteriovoracaceae bacterium]|nr:polymer-forming cytoskeletal protein [Bacteriovoracaceae bacterium]